MLDISFIHYKNGTTLNRGADWSIENQNGAQQKGRGEHQRDESNQYYFFGPSNYEDMALPSTPAEFSRFWF